MPPTLFLHWHYSQELILVSAVALIMRSDVTVVESAFLSVISTLFILLPEER